jgi:hypothetical protein
MASEKVKYNPVLTVLLKLDIRLVAESNIAKLNVETKETEHMFVYR